MNLRLEALKDMKEDLLMRRCKISDEIEANELMLIVPVMEYNFNDIKREIRPHPINVTLAPKVIQMRVSGANQVSDNNGARPGSNQIIMEEEYKS